MIDDPERVGRLLEVLRACLPAPARLTPELVATLRVRQGMALPDPHCRIVDVHYLGDEGGIVCGVLMLADDDGGADGEAPTIDAATGMRQRIFASITHLRLDPRLPFARDVAAYQRHRVKKLRQAR